VRLAPSGAHGRIGHLREVPFVAKSPTVIQSSEVYPRSREGYEKLVAAAERLGDPGAPVAILRTGDAGLPVDMDIAADRSQWVSGARQTEAEDPDKVKSQNMMGR
jgi:hypothetical protein